MLALELFEVDGRLLANEIAPRVHNTGHWTIDGAVTSQFENHLRAILGLPLGSTEALAPVRDDQPDRRRAARSRSCSRCPGAHLHLYGKAPRPGRKIGHVTLVGASEETVAEATRSSTDGRRLARERSAVAVAGATSIMRPHEGQRRRRRFVSSICFVLPLATIVQPTAATATTDVS